MNTVDKILGADVELGNMIERADNASISKDYAARCLLAEIDGVPSRASAESVHEVVDSGPDAGTTSHGTATVQVHPPSDPQDWGRRFLTTNGGCAYIDMGHLEVCMPEVRSARDFVRYHHAGLALARAAREAAAAKLPEDERLVIMANNSDRHGNSWGGHLNVLVTRELWDRIFARMYPELFVLAAFQVSSILYTGQGKVGSENGKPWTVFQITQRADFMERIEAQHTTFNRPICNSRDEPHTHRGELARLHIIFHDTTLTHVSNFLKAGVTQLVLALMETGWCDRRVMLESPLEALTVWGHDPDLKACAELTDGRSITAIEHQWLFLDAVKTFVINGDAQGVPDADRIVALWEETLGQLERGDTAVLARRLDWVLKRELLARVIERNPNLGWESPSIRAADLRFASLDAADSLYEAVAGSGGVDTLATQEEIERACNAPPEDTRAWSRTMLLRLAGRSRIESVNWDQVRLHPAVPGESPLVLRFVDPRRHGRSELWRHARDAKRNTEVHTR